MCCVPGESMFNASPSGSATLTRVGKIKTFGLSRSGETIDITTMDSGAVREFCIGKTTATLSVTALRCYADPGQAVLEAATSPTPVDFYINFALLAGSGLPEFFSKAFMSTNDENKSFGEGVEVTYDIQLSGLVRDIQA